MILTHFNPENPLTLTTCREILTLFAKQYGENYHHNFLNNPEKLVSAIQEGVTHVFVAQANLGSQVLGCCALQIESPEMIRLVRVLVSADQRGNGIGSALVSTALNFCEQLPMPPSLIAADVVTTLPFMQLLLTKFGFVETGFSIARLNDYFGTGKRESTLRMVKYNNLSNKQFTTYLPEKYLELVATIGCTLNITRNFSTINSKIQVTDDGEILVDESNSKDMQIYYIKCCSKVNYHTLHKVLNQIYQAAPKFISIELLLNEPCSIELINNLTDDGFIFSSYEPQAEGDKLRLQWCSEFEINLNWATSERGKSLLTRVQLLEKIKS
jgi:GNAT superfamily N-acetyltransferase